MDTLVHKHTFKQSGELWNLSVWDLVNMNKHHFPRAASLSFCWIKADHLCSFPFKSAFLLPVLTPGNVLFHITPVCCSVPRLTHLFRLTPQKSRRYRPLRNCSPMTLPLTKSVSMLAISQRDIDGEWRVVKLSACLTSSVQLPMKQNVSIRRYSERPSHAPVSSFHRKVLGC